VRDDLGGVAGTHAVTLGARRRLGRRKQPTTSRSTTTAAGPTACSRSAGRSARRPAPSPARRIGARVRRTR